MMHMKIKRPDLDIVYVSICQCIGHEHDFVRIRVGVRVWYRNDVSNFQVPYTDLCCCNVAWDSYTYWMDVVCICIMIRYIFKKSQFVSGLDQDVVSSETYISQCRTSAWCPVLYLPSLDSMYANHLCCIGHMWMESTCFDSIICIDACRQLRMTS